MLHTTYEHVIIHDYQLVPDGGQKHNQEKFHIIILYEQHCIHFHNLNMKNCIYFI